ncbi:MAG: Flp pilus assembly complex ATPase component TadA, partial [Planctomycetaceae bacterium]|nr:Flp pilus assembly complex ATPase component TadA [Planctomycetaceae bacterium]
MNAASSGLLADRLPGLALDAPHNVPQIVDAMLAAAQQAGASDLHLVPGPDQLDLYWRLDGVLKNIDQLPHAIAPNIVARLKVLAELLTYRVEVPQEGRIRTGNARVEMRVSTFPTLYGEKVVIRLFVGSGRYRRLADLGLPADVTAEMKDLLAERGGLLLATGPAGCGKTTTVYAALREFTEGSDGGRSLVSIEDPIEAVIPGVAQSQVQPAAGFTYDIGLRSLLRQDPDVMLVGEIRDRGTAELVFQASLAGHLVLSTYHAGDSIAALQRLEDMGIERYQLKSGLLGIVSQRLMRRLCECAVTRSQPEERLGLPVADVRVPG